jgi:hypothetical protein
VSHSRQRDPAWSCRGERERGSSAPQPSSPGWCSAPASPTTPNHRSGYVPLTPDLYPQADETTGQTIVIDDTLTCLSHADPGGLGTLSLFDDSPASQAAYDAAFDA